MMMRSQNSRNKVVSPNQQMQGGHDNCNGQSNVKEQPMGSVDMAHKTWFS